MYIVYSFEADPQDDTSEYIAIGYNSNINDG
jgi:hypothetical protein